MHYDCFKGILSLQGFVNEIGFSSSKNVSAKFHSNVCVRIYLNNKCMIFLLQNSHLALPYCSDRRSVLLQCPKTSRHCDVCLKEIVLSLYHVQKTFFTYFIYCLFIYFLYSIFKLVLLNLVIEKYIIFQDKSKDKVSKLDTLRHSIAGMIRSPKSVLGSSSVSFITESPAFSTINSSFLSVLSCSLPWPPCVCSSSVFWCDTHQWETAERARVVSWCHSQDRGPGAAEAAGRLPGAREPWQTWRICAVCVLGWTAQTFHHSVCWCEYMIRKLCTTLTQNNVIIHQNNIFRFNNEWRRNH